MPNLAVLEKVRILRQGAQLVSWHTMQATKQPATATAVASDLPLTCMRAHILMPEAYRQKLVMFLQHGQANNIQMAISGCNIHAIIQNVQCTCVHNSLSHSSATCPLQVQGSWASEWLPRVQVDPAWLHPDLSLQSNPWNASDVNQYL